MYVCRIKAVPLTYQRTPSSRSELHTVHFNNAGDNVTLTLYNMMLTSQKPCLQITSVIAAKQTA